MAANKQRLVPFLFWRLYIVLGAFSATVGTFALLNPGFIFPARGMEQTLVRVIGGVFLVTGIARIINSVVQLRRITRTR